MRLRTGKRLQGGSCEKFLYCYQVRRQMIRHLMTVRLAAASQRLIFFADGQRLVVAARFCSACWQSQAYGGAPTASVGCVFGQIAVKPPSTATVAPVR